ncbi:hypothetical protein [Amycolatopsis kentuckyensis]|uniref:hypothetical protein n=1 Tax=Amycolatopsis kentuckyensis TaxID=218823 RepID=UPI0035657F3F
MTADLAELQEAIRGNQGTALFAPPPAWAAPDFAEPAREARPAARFCPKGHRLRFDTEQAALDRLAEIQDAPPDPNRLYSPVYARECRSCGGYHLTSKPGKPWRSGKTPRAIRTARRPR